MSDLLQLDATLLKRFLYPVVVVDQETLAIVDANDAVTERYGYSREQLLAMKIADLRSLDERHLAAAATQEMSLGPTILGPFKHLTAAGDILRTDVVSIPGEFRGRPSVVGILVDATERVSAQAQARIMFDQMPVAAWIHDCETLEILAVNDAAVELYGYSRDELLTMTLDQFRPDKSREAIHDLFRTYQGGEIKRIYRHVRKDGKLIDVAANSTPIPFGRRNARLGAGRDVTEELAAERALQRANARLEEAQEITHLGSWRHDFVAHETYRSREMCRILGADEKEEAASARSTIYDYVHPEDIGLVRESLATAADGVLVVLEHRIVRADGEVRWVTTRGRVKRDPAGDPVSATGTLLDITEQKARNEELRFLAYHDQLTGLPNRQSMNAILERAISSGSAAVFFIDFDSFKEINDTFGHGVGDALLQQIATRLKGISGVDTCRWGGDEFVVVARLGATQSHNDVLFQLRTVLSASYECDERTFFITPSIGIALYPEHGDRSEDLMRNADTAMYEAKRVKNTSALFRPSMAEATKQRLYVQNGLHEALRSDHLALVYQPIVSNSTGNVVGAEALVRWHDPERGVQLPDTFIEVAERSGLIVPIGEYVISEACRMLHSLRSQGLLIPVSVNVSSLQLETSRVVESIRKWTKMYDVEPQALNVEITESGIMRDVEHGIAVLTELRAIGVRIALDDFGAGYSSLSHLKSLPLDIMKIDKSLVRGIIGSERDRQIMTSVLQLATATNLYVIAEGVENAEQAAILAGLGCDTLQGFYFSRPLYADDFHQFVSGRVVRAAI